MKSGRAPRRAVLAICAAFTALLGATNATAEPTPHLDFIAHYLNQRSPGTEGKVWWMSGGNVLPPGWLLQTPNCWGQSACGKPPPGGTTFVQHMREMIARARTSVDIAELYQQAGQPGAPDGEFFDAIANGLKEGHQAHPNDEPVVRLLIGLYPSAVYFPEKFANALRERVGEWVKVQSGDMQTTLTSWNHAKIVDVDGTEAIVGGMNYWSSDYLNTLHPVSDVSMQVKGPAAQDVSHFTDLLWKYTCTHRGVGVVVFLRGLRSCVMDIPRLVPYFDPHGVPTMVVGKLGNGIQVPGEEGKESGPITRPAVKGACIYVGFSAFGPALSTADADVNTSRSYEYRNPGEDALRALIASASRSIFISQQDLLSCLPDVSKGLVTESAFDDRLFNVLADKVIQGVPIKIVLSDPQSGYHNPPGWPPQAIAGVLTAAVAAHGLTLQGAAAKVCHDLGLATIRNDSKATWGDGERFRNHAKVVAVDDQAFYIGSGNLYPSRLQELGLIVEDRAAAAHLKSTYLDPLWNFSRADAVIDPQTGKCG